MEDGNNNNFFSERVQKRKKVFTVLRILVPFPFSLFRKPPLFTRFCKQTADLWDRRVCKIRSCRKIFVHHHTRCSLDRLPRKVGKLVISTTCTVVCRYCGLGRLSERRELYLSLIEQFSSGCQLLIASVQGHVASTIF